MSLKFTPPRGKKLPRYASYGSGQMKTHTSLGAAKQSLANRCAPYHHQKDRGWLEGFILELVDGEWYTLYHVPEGTGTDDLPWKKDAWEYEGGRYYERGVMWHEPYYDKENYRKVRLSKPMTMDEYAEWRVRVALEQHGITKD